jgi:hypothetical protein
VATSSRRQKIELSISEGTITAPPAPEAAPAKAGPRIFMQDDDVEFEDLDDEEEPDDDLDI